MPHDPTLRRLATLAVAALASACIEAPRPQPKQPGAATSAEVPPLSRDSLSTIFASKEDVGLRTEDLQLGMGPSIQLGDMAKVHYTGRLVDGTEFDSSRNRPGNFEFTLGKGEVIKGFERGMVGMKVGGVRRIRIPWKLGYGETGSPPRIPPRADLVFDIELLDIPVPEKKAPPGKGPPAGGASPPM